MLYRDHINLTTSIVVPIMGIVAVSSLYYGTGLFFSPLGAAIFAAVLAGTASVDLDLLFWNTNHRESPFHTVEYPFLLMLGSFAGYRWSGDVTFLYGGFYFVGWLLHLLGDFFQGGVKSLIRGRRIGFTDFTWGAYFETQKGFLIGFLLWVSAIASLTAVMWYLTSIRYSYATFLLGPYLVAIALKSSRKFGTRLFQLGLAATFCYFYFLR